MKNIILSLAVLGSMTVAEANSKASDILAPKPDLTILPDSLLENHERALKFGKPL